MLMSPLRTLYELVANRSAGPGARSDAPGASPKPVREPGPERPLRVVASHARAGNRRLPLVAPVSDRYGVAVAIARDVGDPSEVRR